MVGASHLRVLADGHLQMPTGCFEFGYLSVCGANAADLTLELRRLVPPDSAIDCLCVMAPR